MVRETRHLWVGNLPDNIREDRIREHFKRYGRVQSVKLLPRSTKEETGEGTMACTVAFMDIKSASKAHNTEHKVDDRTLTTEYYEPAAIPSSASPQTTTSPYSTSPGSTRFPNGHSSSDEHGPFAERFYERNSSRTADGGEFIRRGGGSSGYHDASRSRNRDRGFRNGPYNVIMDRGGSHRTLNNSWSYDSGGGSGGGSGAGTGGATGGGRYNSQNETGYVAGGATTAATTSGSGATAGSDAGSGERRGTSDQSTKKKTKSRSGSRSPSPSGSTSSRSPSRSRSRSSSSSSSSSTSRTSSTITPISRRTAANSHLAHSDDRRPLAICVRNLPLRSSDTSLKDGLYHEYKKHGKVTSVKVVGQNSERHAIVCFKKPEDVEKALEVSYDKLFFGCKIDVASYQGFDVDDNDLRPYEAEIDEFHPKATRTLFIGNLEKDTTASDLRKHFDQFGEIIEIDIKNQGNVSLYAFCQYSDIVSVVKAIRKMDGEHLGNNRIKLGFGKSMPTNVVWVDGIVEIVNEKYLRLQFDPFGPISKVSIDRDRGQSLIFYEQMVGAQSAVSKMRGYNLKGSKIQVDFASRECQQSFYEHLEKQVPVVIDRVEERRDSTSRSFDSSRFARYDTPTRPRASSYSSRSSIAASQVASAIPSPGTPGSVTPRGTSSKTRVGRFNDYYEGTEVTDRHFRNYDEYSQGSAASQDDPYDPDSYSYNHHESPMLVDVIETRTAQNVISVDHSAVPYAPPDIRNLQKERVHLLEQLEDCPSSGDEHIVSKKRLKLDLLDSALGTDVIIEANRDHRKVMEVRRLSDVGLKHHSRRPSADNKHSRDLAHDRSTLYIPHGICKRRKTGGSDSGSRSHHYDHSGSESVGGSRPGTPLCDERPENFQPSEPRRAPRERNGPISLPLPRFASQIPGRGSVSIAGIKGQKDVVLSSPPPAVTSPRISNPKPTSPVHVPPPASPPPRPPSLSSNSSDSENPPSPSLDERIKSLDEKYEKWSGSRALSAAGGDALAKLDATREKFRLRHKLLDFDLKEVQPSEIVKSVMAKRSVFDEDLKRLENVGEKYEPKDFTLFPRAATIIQGSVSAVPSTTASTIKITSPSLQISSVLSPRSSGNNMIPAKGLQYPFPSHPPIQPATPTLLQQTPPATPSSIASPTPQIQTSTTTRSSSHGENRLKSCASASSDNRLSSKVNVNRSVVLNNSATTKTNDKNSGNISSDQSASAAVTSPSVETKTSRSIKPSDKITSRRDSNNCSPRGEIKTRRNSDVGTRRTEDIDKFSDISSGNDRKTERGKSEERKKEHQKEKQRLENEMLERERLEKEQQEKERLEKERLEREKQEREKELEKERLEKEKQEKEKAERERLEKEHQEQERREQERLKREREEQERLRREKEEAEREKALQEERQRKEKEETERKERELKEKLAEEERQAKKERQARKERHEAEKLERERRREEEKKSKDDNHEKRKDDYNKHRENHGESRHKDNNVNNTDKSISNNEHKYVKQGSKEEKDKSLHEIVRKNDSHDRYNSEKYNKHSEKDNEYRRKDSIKENRDNNTHEKSKDFTESRHLSLDLDKPKSDKNKDNSLPGNVGIKRRMSSQDTFDHTSEAKKQKLNSDHKKISERRDSKDSTRSDDKVKPKLKTSKSLEEKLYQTDKPNFNRVSDEKRREKDRDREDRHRNKQKFDKQKAKSKSREKDLRESPTATTPISKELTDKDFLARLELRSTDDVEMQREKRPDTKDKRKSDFTSNDTEKREKDDKRNESRRKDKTGEKCKSRDDQGNRSFDDKNKSLKREMIRKSTTNSSDNSDSDEPRKHSIFDIVDDEPAYISMYDKVKARSCKNMQKQEEEKRQEKIKAKFSQLKQSRAKREEKKRSTSWDEDSDSDRERNDKGDSKSRRHKMLIISSDDESSDFEKSNKKRGVFDDSHSDRHKQDMDEISENSDDEMSKRKSSKSSRSIKETSDDYKNSIKSDLFSMSKMSISSYVDLNMYKVKDEFRSTDKDRKMEKQDHSFDKKDTGIKKSDSTLPKVKSEKINNHYVFSSSDDELESKPTLANIRSQKTNSRYMFSDDSSVEKDRTIDTSHNSLDTNDLEQTKSKTSSSNKSRSQKLTDHYVFSSDDDSSTEKRGKTHERNDPSLEVSKKQIKTKSQKDIQRFTFSSDDDYSVEHEGKKQDDSSDRNDVDDSQISHKTKSQILNNRYGFSNTDESSIEKDKTENKQNSLSHENNSVEKSKRSLSDVITEKSNNRYGFSSTDESTEFKKHKKKQKRTKHSLITEDTIKLEPVDSPPQNDSTEKIKHHDKKKQHGKKDKKHDKSKEREKSKKSKKNKSTTKNDLYEKYLFGHTSDSSENDKDNEKSEEDRYMGLFPTESEEETHDYLMSSKAHPEDTATNTVDNNKSVNSEKDDQKLKKRKERKRKEKERLIQEAATAAAFAEDTDPEEKYPFPTESDDERCMKILNKIMSDPATSYSKPVNNEKEDQKIKRKERKRKEKERLLQEAAAAAALAEAADHFNENSMDFADMGKQLEANIKDEPVSDKDKSVADKKDVFKYYDNTMYQDTKKDDRKESREKKKKRKKSKEERQKHHHHHHHHHHEKNKVHYENKKETLTVPKEEPCSPPMNEVKTQSQSLPNLLEIPSPPQEKSSPKVENPPLVKTEPIEISTTPTPTTLILPQHQSQAQISPDSSKEKKRDKFIPGFGADIDETIHENAVKSISDFDAIKPADCPKIEDVKLEKSEETPEEKPRAVISQEETEDAVAALLGESFSNEFGKHYAEDDLSNPNDDSTVALVDEPTVQDDEEMRQAVQSLGAPDLEVKPETPQSEHELQIDTDTEEQDEVSLRFVQQPKTPDMSELLQPPKTPDIPTYYRPEEAKLTLSPLVIKTTPSNIGSPPSLAPITQQPSIITNAKRNLEKIEMASKIPSLALPPLIEPSRTIIHPWATKTEDVASKVESKLTVVTKVSSPQVQQNLLSTPSTIGTAPSLRASVVKVSEASYPPLSAISKQETTTKADIPLATIPILQVATPALHSLQQASPSSQTQDLSSGTAKSPVPISKIRLPITSVMVSKPLQPSTINLPQPRVAFPTEPPKLIPTQDARPRMVYQNAGVATSFPFNANQKMLVQTNIPMARGLLVPARPGHFSYIPSQVAFNSTLGDKSIEISKASPAQAPNPLGQSSPTKIIQMKPQSIIISPNSHITPVINSQKIMKNLTPDNPPSLVAISSTPETSTGILSSPNNQTNVITANAILESNTPHVEKLSSDRHTASVPITDATVPKDIEDNKSPLQKLDTESDNKLSDEAPLVQQEQKEAKPEIKVEDEEPKQKLAIVTVTEELNKSLQEKLENENKNQIKEDIIESKVEMPEIKPDIKVEDHEVMKPKVESDSQTLKEPEKIEEEKTDSESIVSDISKDCSSADMPIKDLLLDGREDKEDSDYWSPKDVNIDSVIKTLCSADEMSNHSTDNISSKGEEDHPKQENIFPSQKEQEDSETSIKEPSQKEADVAKSDSETLEDSVEDEEKEVVSRISTRRGGRGRGRKGRGGIERGGIQTRRGKIQPKEPATPPKRGSNARGGRPKLERKVSKTESEPPADIYEFREDEENRPRLILTIKQSNTNSAAIQSAVVKEVPKETPLVQTPPKPVEVKEKTEDFTQPAGSTNTRKSKRLQEKDIFRTNVDDTIEDVVKNVVTRSSSLMTRRSTRQPAPAVKPVLPEAPRKSTRGRRIGRRASEVTDETSDEKEKSKPSEGAVGNTPVEAKVEVEKPKDTATLPVTATEKEENKPQVPVKESVIEKPPLGLKAAVLRRIKGEMGQEPMTLIDPVTGLLTPMRECEENKYIPVPGENKPGVATTTSQPSIVVTAAEFKSSQPTVITSSQQTATVPSIKHQPKLLSLKAHVLSSQAAQAVVTQIPSTQKQNAVIASSASSPVGVEIKTNIPPSQNLSVNVCTPNFVPSHASPRTHLTLASSSPKPVTVKQPVSSPSQMYNLMSQQMMQINKASPPGVVPKGIVSNAPLLAQQSIIKQVPLAKSAMISKNNHAMHVPAGVPSSVLGKIPSQTMVTNATRLMQGKNMMEPPKVDVSLNSLMSVRGLSSLSPQGQPRHHTQPNMPVSGYEATLAETIPHFPPGSVTLRPHDLPPPHYMHPSHVMYQQYLRQSYHFPRSSVVSGGIEKSGDGQEGEEAPVTSPPLELRISNSVGLSLSSRGAAVPHSLHSPHDRATDSPQIGQVYNMPTARMQHYNLNRYYEPAAEPPPAHRPVTSHTSLAALGSDRPPLSHMAALGAPDRALVSHLPPDRPLGSHLPHDRPLGSHLPPDRPHSGHSALAGHLPLGNPERPSSSHLPPDRPTSSHLTPDRLSGISTPDRPVSAHTMTLGAGLGAAGNLMGAVARHIGVDAPTSQRGLQAATPPHASQVPPQAESLNILLKQYPKMWQGLLALKNDQAAVHMYFISGNDYVAKCSLPKNTDGSTPPLRIFQRMRLEPPQVEGVARKMQMEKEHCCLLALPCGMDHMDVLKQSNNLTNGFIHYLQQKQAAGIVNVAAPGTTQPPAYVVHIFPTCSFVEENLRRLAPSLLECVSDIAHLLIVITTV